MAHGTSHGHDVGSQGPGTKPGTDHAVDHHEGHPDERTYITVAAILAVVTAVEVAIYYIEAIEDFLVPLLIVLSVGKFVAVVGYFMHLKFDDRRFMWMFVGGLLIASAAFLGTAAVFAADQFSLR